MPAFQLLAILCTGCATLMYLQSCKSDFKPVACHCTQQCLWLTFELQ